MVGSSGRSQELSACVEATDGRTAGHDLQVSAHKLAVVPTAPEDVAIHEVSARPQEGRGSVP